MQTVDAGGLGIGDDHPTRIMGVLNVSRESPYDPSVFDDDVGEAAAYVDDEELVGEGADIVDVGLETANKRFDVLSPEQELDRLDTAVETMESVSGDAVFHRDALRRGRRGGNRPRVRHGERYLRFADPEMPEVCREYDVAVAKMASPPNLERPGAVEETPWAERRSRAWVDEADYVDQVYEALKQNGLTPTRPSSTRPSAGGPRPRPSRTTGRRSAVCRSFANSGSRCSSRSTARTSSATWLAARPRRAFAGVAGRKRRWPSTAAPTSSGQRRGRDGGRRPRR